MTTPSTDTHLKTKSLSRLLGTMHEMWSSQSLHCLILVAFAVLVIGMFQKLTAAENEWTRAIYLYTGVEAIVFAAAGFLFGREVNRQRAESAEKTATVAGIKTDVAQAQLSEYHAST